MRKRTLRTFFFTAAGCILLAVAGTFLWLNAGRLESLAALVGGEEIVITADAPGVVEDILVRPGDVLKAGALLLTLDASGRQAALDAARSDLARLTEGAEPPPLAYIPSGMSVEHAQRLAAAQQAEEAARVVVEQRSVSLAQARFERRRLDLRNPRPGAEILAAAVEREKMDSAALAAAEEQLAHASRLRDELSRPPYSDNKPTAVPSEELGARLARRVQEAEEHLAAARVMAPVDAIVRQVAVRPGEAVVAGSVAVRLEPLDMERLWISAQFTGADGARLKPGMRCRIRVRKETGVSEWRGVVQTVQAETLPEDGGRVFVRARLLPGRNDAGYAMRIGETATVIVETRYPLLTEDAAGP